MTHKYLHYIESPRYYNRLLDAWEHRYGGSRREKGIALIRKFCEDKVHLTVPPQPAKKVNFLLSFFVGRLFIWLWFVFSSFIKYQNPSPSPTQSTTHRFCFEIKQFFLPNALTNTHQFFVIF